MARSPKPCRRLERLIYGSSRRDFERWTRQFLRKARNQDRMHPRQPHPHP